jgi:hypothetical protein
MRPEVFVMPGESMGQRAVVRRPAVAGTFYPAEPAALRRELDACFLHPLGPGSPPDLDARIPLAVVSPHAGIVYSGPFAAHAYAALGAPKIAIVLGPNHYGIGAPLALSSAAAWRTPLGEVALDVETASLLRDACPALEVDDRAHAREHSIELQLVFLQRALGSDVRIVPIALARHDLDTLHLLGRALALAAVERGAVVVASTDLSHYLPEAETHARDRRLVERIEALDVAGLVDLVARGESMACGAAGVIAVIVAARELGVKEARLLAYGTSGDTGGPLDAVVGYSALRIERPAAS